ncbi:HTH-type transcriptional regulator LysM [Candidatus Gugararchaeum adminiculabundum]|nr:HTH-type transcriptional regulator LysM [Candidatus Gugararchaeum adminiculabundum]
MDETDSKLLSLLSSDASQTNTQLAKAVGLTEAAIRKRVKKLLANGAIKKFTIELGDEVGGNFSAICLVSIGSGKPAAAVAKKIKSLHGVRSLYEITGDYDLSIRLEAESSEKLNELLDEIRNVEGVKNTATNIILKKW